MNNTNLDTDGKAHTLQEFMEDTAAIIKAYPDLESKSEHLFNAIAPDIPSELHSLALTFPRLGMLTEAECL